MPNGTEDIVYDDWRSNYNSFRVPSKIARIRNLIQRDQYEMSAHVKVEMAEDRLDIVDVESVVFNGRIVRHEKDDVRGTKYIAILNHL